LCSAIYGDKFSCRKIFSCLPEDDTYEIVPSKPEIGVGIISRIEPSREHSLKIVFKWNGLGVQKSECRHEYSQKKSHSQKEFT